MSAETLLRDECRRLHALESGLVATLDVLEGHACGRKTAVSIVMLIEAADRHLLDLEGIFETEGWPFARVEEHPMARSWREEAERDVLTAPRGPETDARCLGLLRRSVGLLLPCYESARLYAFHAERPLIARMMRLAIEDEMASLERLRSAAELGVNLRTALGGPL